MGCSQKYLIVLTFFLCGGAQCGKVCDFSNKKCATQAAKRNYQLMLTGIPGVSKPLGSFHEDKIEGETSTFKYVLKNVSLDGFQNCDVKQLALNTQEKTYEFVLQCPRLVLTSADIAYKGSLRSGDIDHEASLKVILDDYIFTFRGNYEKKVDDKDGKVRVFVKTHTIEIEPKAKVTFELVNIHKGNKDQALALTNENWKSLENPTMNIMCSKFIDSLNIFLKHYPVDYVLAE